MRTRLLISMALLVVGLAACGSTSHLSEQVSRQPALGSQPVLVVQSPEGDSWVRLLRSGGLAATEDPFGYLPTDSAAVVPDDREAECL